MSERGYKVRIRPPERGDVGMLVAMIGPLVELDQAALSRALANGPAIVGDDMARGEAEQMLAVFTSLGADAELLLPDGSVNRKDSLPGNNTLPLHAKGIAAAIDAVTGRNQTQPFDARALRAEASRRAQAAEPSVGSHPTQPFNPRALRAAARQMEAERATGPHPSARAPQTRPMELSQFKAPPSSAPRATEDSAAPPDAAPGQTLRGEAASLPVRREPASRPPRGTPIRSSTPPRSNRPLRSRPPRAMGLPGAERPNSLPPPVRLDGLPPIDDVVDSVNTASVAFAPEPAVKPKARRDLERTPPSGMRAVRQTNPVVQAPPRPSESQPVAVVGSHPTPDRQRGMAIRERITDSRVAPPDHSVGAAVLLGALLPGMGQLYNGQRDRAVWFAVGSLLIIPWIWAVFDAGMVASAIRDRRHPHPRPGERRAAMPGQFVLDIAVFVALAGGLTLLLHTQRPERGAPGRTVASDIGAPGTRAPETVAAVQTPTKAPATAAPQTAAPATAAPVTAATAATAAPVSAPPSLAPKTAAPASAAPATTAKDQIESLLSEGRTACSEGRYADCERLVRAVIAKQPRHREAHQLLVDAISQQSAQGVRSSPTSVAPVNETP